VLLDAVVKAPLGSPSLGVGRFEHAGREARSSSISFIAEQLSVMGRGASRVLTPRFDWDAGAVGGAAAPS
jgi:hypothetical protein